MDQFSEADVSQPATPAAGLCQTGAPGAPDRRGTVATQPAVITARLTVRHEGPSEHAAEAPRIIRC
jgi:hypothetical protein